MFIELYKFNRLVMHLKPCSMDLGRDIGDCGPPMVVVYRLWAVMGCGLMVR